MYLNEMLLDSVTGKFRIKILDFSWILAQKVLNCPDSTSIFQSSLFTLITLFLMALLQLA